MRHVLLSLLLLGGAVSLVYAQASWVGCQYLTAGSGISITCPDTVGRGGATITASGGGTITGGGTSGQVTVWSGATAITGFTTLTYSAPTLTVGGTANSLNLAGSATGNPVTITATGSDSDINVSIQPKGFGSLALGPAADAYAPGAGFPNYISAVNLNAPDFHFGIYAETTLGDHAAGTLASVLYLVGRTLGAGATQDIAELTVASILGDSFLPAGRTLTLGQGYYVSVDNGAKGAATKLSSIVGVVPVNFDTGTITLARAIAAQAHAGTINPLGSTITTNVMVDIESPATSGTMTTNYGLRIADQTAGSTNYSIYTGAGALRFGGAATFATRAGVASTVAVFTSDGILSEVATLANAFLTNSSITINGSPISLGGSVSVGTVTSVATASPITGGTITTTGTIACATCNAMTSNPWVVPGSVATTGGLIGGGSGSTNGQTAIFSANNQNTPLLVVPSNSWLRNFTFNYAAAQATGAWTSWAFQIGSLAQTYFGPSVNLISGAAAGVYSQPILARVSAGTSLILTSVAPTVAVSATAPTGWSAELVADSGAIMIGAYIGGTIVNGPATRYMTPWGVNSASGFFTTALAGGGVSPITGTVQKFCFGTTTTQDASGTLVFTVYVNGSATSITATQAAGGAAGIFCDSTHTASITANQALSVEVINNATTGTQTLRSWSLEIVPTSGTPGIIGGYVGAVAAASTTFFRPFTSTSNATETNVRLPLARAGTTTNLCVNVAVATAATAVATLVKNGTDTSLTVTTTGNVTGISCGTGSVSWAQNDTMTLKVVQAAGTGTTIAGWSTNY